MIFAPDFLEFLALLQKNEVEYLIVGGYALALHGKPRQTGDLDIWLNPTQHNSNRVVAALNDFGFASLGIVSEDLSKDNYVVQVGYPPLRIDLITTIDGVKFDEAMSKKELMEVDGVTIRLISLEDLLANKIAVGRPQDLVDVIILKKLLKT